MISLDLSQLSSSPYPSSPVPAKLAGPDEAEIIHDFLDRIKTSDTPWALEPLSWIWLESYLYGQERYSLSDALTYSQFPLLTKTGLLKDLAKTLHGDRPNRDFPFSHVTSSEWIQYVVDYARDHYRESAAKSVRAYVELCIVTRIGSELRLIHRKNLLAKIEHDERLMDEISAGIHHFVPLETVKPKPGVAAKLLEPNGFDLARGRARVSPTVRHAHQVRPDVDSPIVVARDLRKRRSYANKMVTPVHRYKYPMPKLDLQGLTARTRYSRLFRFVAGAAMTGRPF